ncbi:glycosyltransferase [Mumia sp. DW29H23]|uniref:glycosyltransferase n=1 Tax=Mumia sp. DW29H23 TaxID=3421241 RepID=UPI003D68D79D
MEIALAHDYLTQRGGAERVAEVMARAFPAAPMYTTLYDPDGTFPEIAAIDVRPSRLDRWSVLRHHHRAALPFLARTVSRMHVDADVLLASSSGWAHGIPCSGRKVVYCHAPARWLYQAQRYLGADDSVPLVQRARRSVARTALASLTPRLRAWDQEAAHSADRYLVNSTVVRRAVRDAYGIDAEVVPPPPALMPAGDERAVPGIGRPYLLCVARLLPYKNVDVVVEAVKRAGGVDLVVVGEGPDRTRLEGIARGSARIHLVGRVEDAELRWLYRHCDALVAASYEDYGLSPLEAATFGRPTLALRDGGFLDTVVDGTTGLFFDAPTPDAVADAVTRHAESTWDTAKLVRHADDFSEQRFVARLREVVDEELRRT